MHFCSYLWTCLSKFHNWGTVGIPGCRRGQSTLWRHLSHLGFSAILKYIKNLQKALKVTQIVCFPQDLTHRIFRPSHKSYHLDFLNLLPFNRSSQSILAPTRQTGSEAISLWCIDVSMPNLVCGRMMPSWAAIGLTAMLLGPRIAACSYVFIFAS